MKNLNTILSIIYVIFLYFAIKILISNFSDGKMFITIISTTLYLCHLLAWLFPKWFFDICWKLSKSIVDGFDYETNFRNLKKIDLGMNIFSNLLISSVLIFEFFLS